MKLKEHLRASYVWIVFRKIKHMFTQKCHPMNSQKTLTIFVGRMFANSPRNSASSCAALWPSAACSMARFFLVRFLPLIIQLHAGPRLGLDLPARGGGRQGGQRVEDLHRVSGWEMTSFTNKMHEYWNAPKKFLSSCSPGAARNHINKQQPTLPTLRTTLV